MKYLNFNRCWFLCLILSTSLTNTLNAATKNELSLMDAVELAIANDPWIQGSEHKQTELNAMAVSVGQLSDPTMSVGLANIGADKFDFNQEPMSQFKVGVTQMFTRGKTRTLKTEQMGTLASEQPILRAQRIAMMRSEVSQIWLDVYQAEESIRLIENERSLFEQMVDLVEASYSSGFGQTRQHDLIRAQLEVTRLEDRLTQLEQMQASSYEELKGYLIQLQTNQPNEYAQNHSFRLKKKLPEINLTYDPVNPVQSFDQDQILIEILLKHPALQAIDKKIEAKNIGIDLAQQKYKPAWGLNASYGYRDDTDNNVRRADLFSVGVTFDLPLFTKNRQDQDLKAAISSAAAEETQKSLLLRELMSSFESEHSKLDRLKQRSLLYKQTLLPQMNQQTAATLNAYTHDDGDFTEVVRSKIAELNALIDDLEIDVQLVKTTVKLNYLLVGGNNKLKAIKNNSGDTL